MRAIDWRTSSSRSVNDSAAQPGSMPVSSWIDPPKGVVGERQHAAVGVVDEDDLLGAEQPLGDRQRADLVVGDDASGVADHDGSSPSCDRARRTRRVGVMQATTATFLTVAVAASQWSKVTRRRHFVEDSSVTDIAPDAQQTRPGKSDFRCSRTAQRSGVSGCIGGGVLAVVSGQRAEIGTESNTDIISLPNRQGGTADLINRAQPSVPG